MGVEGGLSEALGRLEWTSLKLDVKLVAKLADGSSIASKRYRHLAVILLLVLLIEIRERSRSFVDVLGRTVIVSGDEALLKRRERRFLIDVL